MNTKPMVTTLSTLVGIANDVGSSTIQGFWEIFEPSSSEPWWSCNREGKSQPLAALSKSDGTGEFDDLLNSALAIL